MSVEQQLAWERRMRPRAAAAALGAGALTLAGGIYSGMTFADVPRASVLSALDRAAGGGDVGGLPSLRIPLYEWYSDHVAQFVIAAAISALGALAIGGALTFLAFATAARREQFPRAGLYVPVVGAALLAVALLLVALGTDATVGSVLDGERTVEAVGDLSASSLLTAGQFIEVAARFTLGAAFLLVALNAMRAGLLTRFMGVLGVIGGVLLALPVFGGPLPVVQVFWLLALGFILLDRLPRGLPPAWQTGTAQPWPSGAELRAQRQGAAAEREAAGEAREAAARPSPATSRKKRKKRR